MSTDYYQILGLAKGASSDEVKKAYRKMAQKYHPDKNPDDKAAEAKFKEITEAYAVLSDPQKKTQYDQLGSERFHRNYSQEDIFDGADLGSIFRDFGFGGANDDMFSQLFGGGRGRGHHGGQGGHCGRHQGMGKGADLSIEVNIPFRQAILGGERSLSYRSEGRTQKIQVKIPPGVEQGQKLRVAGKGASGAGGGPCGDLILQINIEPDSNFTRQDRDLSVKILIPFSGACLGTSAPVPTLEGEKRIKIPAGIVSGSKIRLKGHGVATPKGTRGDLYAQIDVEIPKKLSKAQKILLEELREAGL